MNKIKVFWGSITNDTNIGNYYGYKVHNESLKKYAMKNLNIEIVDNWELSDLCFYITTPETFYDRPPKPTFLFTMFEGTSKLPEIYIQNIKRADFLITPSHWTKELFKDYFPSEKTFVVPHGIEECFTYLDRFFREPKVFRFLWVGAANPRKGYQELILVWSKLGLYLNPNIELYIKTTRVPGVTLMQNRNVILDSRNLSQEEMVQLYHEADCFVMPTRGEGFGFTLAEALATGLPCIATGRSGESEYFSDEIGYTLKYTLGMTNVKSWIHGDLGQTEVAMPDGIDLANKMDYVIGNYPEALIKGLKGSIHIKENFTWEKSVEKLVLAFREGLGRN